MNIAIILAGGTGVRLGGDVPKQYIDINGKPVIAYCLEKFEKNNFIDSIIIVAEESWFKYVLEVIQKYKITKFKNLANAGSSRQHSIINGLNKAYEDGARETDIVVIHDAARPNVSDSLISSCINGLYDADGIMPVISVKDTLYFSNDGRVISSLLNRDSVFAGQAPESYYFGKYYSIHNGLTEDELAIVRGSSEIAYKNGMNIKLIPGDEHNYKITTTSDLEKFQQEMNGENRL